ncbi:MAG: hypothetical protein K9M84_03905 [Spirochaetia bacterium]|nr:hypothetical protein [Spirochaetia bacterium]
MSLEDMVFLPVVLPLLGAALALCAKVFLTGRASRILEYTGVFIGLGLPWLFFVYITPMMYAGQAVSGVIGAWHTGVGIMYRFDGLAYLVNILGFSVAAAAWVYALGAGPKGPSFSSVFLIQTASLAAAIMTADLFNLFVCLEVLGIASYVLIASSDKPGAALASFSYLMVSATAMVFFLLGLYGLYRLTGVLSYEGIASALNQLPDAGGPVALVSLSLIVAAVAMRVAVMPLYGWLPDAHALAPHAISAVLSGVLIKTPLFALSRVLMLMPAGASAGQLMGYAGAVTALAAVVIALSQKDAKRLLAYHSISQIGYIVSAWGAAIQVGTTTGAGVVLMAAAFMHAFYHALFKGLLFLSIGTTVDRAGERNVYVLRGAGRILRAHGERFPVTLICFLIGALSISAIPPLNGYASKAAISYALKGTPHYYLLFAASIGTVASFIKLSRIFWPTPKGSAAVLDDVPAAIPWPIHLSQIFLGLLCVIGGLAAPALFAFVLRLISAGGADVAISLKFYSSGTMIKTLIITASGVLLFLGAITPKGSALLKRVRERRRDFEGLFVSFALGTAALAGWLLL